MEANQFTYGDFENELVEINNRLITLCEKYKVKNGLYAQWIEGKYVIGQNVGELCDDPNNAFNLTISVY